MNLQDCKFGIIVQDITNLSSNHIRIGMISGLTENGSKEVIPIIKFSDGSEYGVHPNNIKIYKGGKNAKS